MKKSCTIVLTVNLMPGEMKRSAVRMKNLKRAHVVVTNKAGIVVVDVREAWVVVVVVDEARVVVAVQHLADNERMLQTAAAPRRFCHDACVCLGSCWTYLPRR